VRPDKSAAEPRDASPPNVLAGTHLARRQNRSQRISIQFQQLIFAWCELIQTFGELVSLQRLLHCSGSLADSCISAKLRLDELHGSKAK
jgi:hypothetical protein